MVLFIIFAQVLLLCALGAEPKIVYSRLPRNGTALTTPTTTESAETDGDVTTTTTTAVSLTGHRHANKNEKDEDEDEDEDVDVDVNDDNVSVSNNAANVYGLQFYAPPVIHGTVAAVDVYGRQVHRPDQRQRPQQPTPAAYHRHQLHRVHRPSPWEPTVAAVAQDGGSGPIQLMNPLQLAAYDDPSTARYSPAAKPIPRAQRPQPATRVIKYAEPATLAYQLPFIAAEADDAVLFNNLPALQYALQHHVVKQPPASPVLHQMYHQNQRIPHAHNLHHIHAQPNHAQQHHRYAAYGGGGTQPVRYTQVPFLYSLPAPPTQRQVAPTEYDLVTQFNRLLKQRERDDRRDNVALRRPDDGVVEGGGGGGGDSEDEEEETTTRPTVKRGKKAKKKKRKKKKPPTTTPVPPPAPVEEERDEEDDRPQQQEDEQPASEEQESQNVHTSEKLPEEAMINNEDEEDFQSPMDGPSQLIEQFGGDLKFEDGEGERVEFQLHGLGGPESYKFGFDTGKGTNRQFRYEERDSGGNVRGHYGYLDNDGKMQVYNYSSHPELGFHSQKAETLEV